MAPPIVSLSIQIPAQLSRENKQNKRLKKKKKKEIKIESIRFPFAKRKRVSYLYITWAQWTTFPFKNGPYHVVYRSWSFWWRITAATTCPSRLRSKSKAKMRMAVTLQVLLYFNTWVLDFLFTLNTFFTWF